MDSVTPNQVIDLLKNKIKPKNNSSHDALFILLHAIMEVSGFKVVGLGESGNQIEEKQLPEEWNNSSDAWSFRYRHYRSGMTFLLKGLRLGDKMIIFALAVEQKETLNLELSVNDYVVSGASLNDADATYKNVDQLIAEFVKTIISKLLPTVQDINSRQEQERQPESSMPRSTQPRQPPYGDDYDPLRIGPPGQPRQPVGPGFPFATGDDDLFPGPGFGYYGPPGHGGFVPPPFQPGRGGGGSLVGPDHPGFGQPRNPYDRRPPNGSFGPQGVRPPPGARYDPYGPPGVNFPGPDHDHLPPPGRHYDDMYL
eukprot:TRINITY_DN1091_c0_g1_i2.p1 TRINITY_DN1091_c0_g1~~TRINITY_DN1091_c0_g1_i2.p1  ORF type:complete len:311 (-),score=54.07 TRINITY_DN1091_c0_g1_i2:53-985(-)